MTVRELRKYLRRCRGNQKVYLAIENIPGARFDHNIALEPIRLMVNDHESGSIVVSGSSDRDGLLEGLHQLDNQPRF